MLRGQFFLLNDLDPRQKGKAASSLSYTHKVKSISSIFLVLKNAYIAAKKKHYKCTKIENNMAVLKKWKQ